jgi:hypothetical protein
MVGFDVQIVFGGVSPPAATAGKNPGKCATAMNRHVPHLTNTLIGAIFKKMEP